ncbi:MAG TPA: hypothetical protein VNO21_00960 [Polyangiaceae bacterium]|nr:hypothetical protein [Polyangiaceae bacterium]
MESTAYQSLRYATDAGSSSIHFATIDQSCPHGTAEDFIAKAIFDYDGDGSPELLLVKEKTGPVGVTEEQSSIWTRRGGRIMRYEPPDASPLREFSDIVDADQDGRPDLASRRTFDNIVDRCGGGTGFAVAPIFLLHSAKNGTFIARDDVTRSYFEDKCSRTLEEQLESADGDIATAIACARVRGASPAAIERTLRKGCTTFSDDACDLALDDDSGKRRVCPTWVLTLTKQTI